MGMSFTPKSVLSLHPSIYIFSDHPLIGSRSFASSSWFSMLAIYRQFRTGIEQFQWLWRDAVYSNVYSYNQVRYVFAKACHGASVYIYIFSKFHLEFIDRFSLMTYLPTVSQSSPHSCHCKNASNKSIAWPIALVLGVQDEGLFFFQFDFLQFQIYIHRLRYIFPVWCFSKVHISFHISKGPAICRDVCWRGEPMLGGQRCWVCCSGYWHSLCWKFRGSFERTQDKPFRHHDNFGTGVPLLKELNLDFCVQGWYTISIELLHICGYVQLYID